MAQDGARLHPGQSAPDHVQVSAADSARGEPDNHIGRLLYPGLLDVVEPYVPDPVTNDRSHYKRPFRTPILDV